MSDLVFADWLLAMSIFLIIAMFLWMMWLDHKMFKIKMEAIEREEKSFTYQLGNLIGSKIKEYLEK